MVFSLWITTLVSCPVFIAGGFINGGKAAGYAFHNGTSIEKALRAIAVRAWLFPLIVVVVFYGEFSHLSLLFSPVFWA